MESKKITIPIDAKITGFEKVKEQLNEIESQIDRIIEKKNEIKN